MLFRSDSLDGVCPSQPLCQLATSLRVVIVVVLESPDLVLELVADFHCCAISSDFGGEGDVPDVGEGVVYHSRLGIISVQVFQVVRGVLSCFPVVVTSRCVDLGVEYWLPLPHRPEHLQVVTHDDVHVFCRDTATVLQDDDGYVCGSPVHHVTIWCS